MSELEGPVSSSLNLYRSPCIFLLASLQSHFTRCVYRTVVAFDLRLIFLVRPPIKVVISPWVIFRCWKRLLAFALTVRLSGLRYFCHVYFPRWSPGYLSRSVLGFGFNRFGRIGIWIFFAVGHPTSHALFYYESALSNLWPTACFGWMLKSLPVLSLWKTLI